MGFISVKTFQYRNLENSEVNSDAKNIYLIGENGQGKTNFIEAIYILCYGSSFRTKTDKNLIAHEMHEMSVFGKYKIFGETHSAAVYVRDSEKRISINGKQVKDRKDLIGNNQCILFSHDDMELVKGTPDRRRFFFNQTVTLVDNLFVDTLRKYSKNS